MPRWSVLGTRTIRRRRSRFTMTVVGVALGIAVLFAVLITNSAIDEGFQRLFRQSDTPGIQIQSFGGYQADMPASVVKTAAQLPGVADVSGGTGLSMRIPGPERESVFLHGGFYENGTAKLPPHRRRGSDMIPVPAGAEPADGKLEIGLSSGTARQLNARPGATVELNGPDGPVKFTVVAINRRRDGKPDDERGAWTSYETVRRITDRPEIINYGYIRLGRGVEPSSWLADHGSALGPSVQLVSDSIGADAFEEVLSSGKAALAGLAGVALFVSAFLIFLTLSMTVAEAAPVHGTLRAVGASKAQVRRTVLGDALVLVLLAIPIGLLLGWIGALGVIAVTRSSYNLPNLPMRVTPWAAVYAAAVGAGVTLVAALVPAQRAASVEPVVAMRAGAEERRGVGRLWLVGLAAILAGVAVVLWASQRRVDAGSSLILFGAVLMVPAVMAPVAAAAGALTRGLARGVGAVGALHLRTEPRRSAYTLALVMVVLAMVFTAGAVHLSLRRNLLATIDQKFPADLAVFAGGRLDESLRRDLLATPGVGRGAALWFTRGVVREPTMRNIEITAFDPEEFFALQDVSWADGDDASVRDALSRGGAVAIPEGAARRDRVGRGDVITMDTQRGPRRYTVAGVYRTFQTPSPLLFSIEDGQRDFALATPSFLAVKVEQGHAVTEVKRRIERNFAERGPVFVDETRNQQAGFIRGQTRFFNVIYAVVLIAVVMGMLGVTNTLVMAILRRTREIGILRAIGTDRWQLRRMALVEAGTIGLAGLILALPLGLLLSFTVLQTTSNSLGVVVEYVYPWPMFAVVGALAVVIALVSSVVPGRHAARVDPARVLRFD